MSSIIDRNAFSRGKDTRLSRSACVGFSALVIVLLNVSCGDDNPTEPAEDYTRNTWQLTLTGDGDEGLEAVTATTDGKYMAAGWTNSRGAGSEDLYVVKFDARGDTIWTRTHGGSRADLALDIAATRHGGAVLCGVTQSFGAGGLDIWVVAIDAAGDTLWTRVFGNEADDLAYSIITARDGGAVVVGTINRETPRHVFTAKVAHDGAIVWDRTYGGNNWTWAATDIYERSNGSFYLVTQIGQSSPFAG